jgi:hypothetical protein
MDAFLHGTEVKLVVPLTDAVGNQLSVSAIEYRVVDQLGVELVPKTTVTGFVADATTATITVLVASNTLPVGAARALRQVDLYCTVGGNIVLLTAAYAITQPDVLVVGVNSFQSYAAAQFIALDIPNIAGWDGASDAQRTAALIDAREHVCQLSFQRLNQRFGQNSLDYLPEGTRDVGSNMFGFTGDLKQLTPAQFTGLPPEFLAALYKAQVAEANVILGGDPVEAKRLDGLLLDSVGESRQMFRPGKPLQLPVSRRALAYLSQFVTFSKRIGRA